MKRTQLFCFTYAGGNAGFFDEIEKDLSGIDLVKLEYRGHGTRHKEPFYESFDELACDLYKMIKDAYAGGDYALFGYSMGSISLVEVLQKILDSGEMKIPCHVFIAAHEPHTKAELQDFRSDEYDEFVKQRTIKFGAVPEVLRDNEAFWRMYLPLYRADYSLIGGYRFEDLDLKSDIPCTVFYSDSDTPLEEIKLWNRYFTGKTELVRYEGSHFFIREHHGDMAMIIEEKVSAL